VQTNDYLRQIDLNPTIGGVANPIVNPLDPRGLCMFGFESTAQEIVNLSGSTVFVSFDYEYDQGIPSVPPPTAPKAHAVLLGGAAVRPEPHRRSHCIVWMYPAGAPGQGVPVEVRVHAWS